MIPEPSLASPEPAYAGRLESFASRPPTRIFSLRTAAAGILLIIGHHLVAAPTASAQTAYQQAVLASDPILYWTFDEAGDGEPARSLVNDDPANELVPLGAVTRVASTTTPGGADLGRAASFDGALDPNSRFEALDLAPATPLDAFAVELWFRIDNSANRYLSETFSDTAESNRPGLIYNFNPGEFEIFAGGRTGTPVSSDEWHHVVAAFYGPGNGVEIFVDGESAATVDRNGGFNQVHGFGRIAIGNTVLNPQAVTGEIDEYAIYDLGAFPDLASRQTHAASIAAHYAVGSAPVDPNLTAPGAVNLGTVLADVPSVPGQIAVSNTGPNETLVITGLAFSGPDAGRFAVAPPDPFPIDVPPGDSDSIGIVFTSGGEPGTYSAQATITSNDSDTPEIEVTVSVTVRAPDPLPATPYQEAVVGHNPVLYWTFDEPGDADNARSLVDNVPANELVPRGAATRVPSTTTAGGADLGRAASFDSTVDPQSRFNSSNLARTEPLTAFAVEFWFLVDDTPERYFSETFSEAGLPNQPGMIYNFNAGELELFAGGRTGALVTTGEWHHVVAAYYGAGEGAEIHLDGQLADTVDRNGGFDHVHAFGEFSVGNTARNPQSITGMIDEYAIYDLAGFQDRSARQAHVSEIAGHYFLSGDPNAFRITEIARIIDGDAVHADVTFTSRSGTTYTIWASTDASLWIELDDSFPGSDGATSTFRDLRDLADLQNVFYYVQENSF